MSTTLTMRTALWLIRAPAYKPASAHNPDRYHRTDNWLYATKRGEQSRGPEFAT